MKRGRRWLEVVVRVSALLSAVAWALSDQPFGRIGAVLLLCAASVASVRGIRSGRWQRVLTVVAYLAMVATAVILIARVWPFAGTVFAVWAAVAAVPTLAWVLMHPAVRHTIAGWRRGSSLAGAQPADASTLQPTRTT